MNPRALFISFFDSDAADIIKNILSLQVCSNPPIESDKLISYPYEIDTKYYTSLVDLCTFDPQKVTKDDISKALIEDVSGVEAFVGYFNTNQRGSFLHAAKCSRFMKESNSNVKMLVCDRCMSTDEISRQEILKWCIENGFELVELHDNDEANDDDDDDDDEDDFKETKGVQRIIEALRCNSWSNMVLKDRSADMSPYMRQLRDEMDDSPTDATTIITAADQNGDGEKLEETMKNLNVNAGDGDDDDGSGEWKKTGDSDNDDDDSDDSDDSDDDDDDPSKYHGFEDNFESLFKNISQMKEEASSLPFEERKKYAENVVKKFWYSMGGNENEFDDDDDEEDEAVN